MLWKKFNIVVLLSILCSVANAKDVSVTLSKEKEYQTIEGQFVISNQQVAWNVLTDYNNLSKFVSSLIYSHTLKREGNLVLVEQEATGKAFIFSKQMFVRLDIMEKPQQAIYFTDIYRKDFLIYQGYWYLEQDFENTRITYHLNFQPRFNVPSFFGKHAMKKNIIKLLIEVRTEILRRSSEKN